MNYNGFCENRPAHDFSWLESMVKEQVHLADDNLFVKLSHEASVATDHVSRLCAAASKHCCKLKDGLC